MTSSPAFSGWLVRMAGSALIAASPLAPGLLHASAHPASADQAAAPPAPSPWAPAALEAPSRVLTPSPTTAPVKVPVAGSAPSLNEIQEAGQRFQPLWSARGMVASQEGRASEAGAAILRRGGNAVDAAVATAFALAVTLPQAGNLGGGGFLVLWLPGASPAAGRGCLGNAGSGGLGDGSWPAAAAAGASAPLHAAHVTHASKGEAPAGAPSAAPAPFRIGASPELTLGQGFAVAVNFRESAPAAARADLFRRADGRVDRQRATRSLESTAVPGSVAGLLLAQRCYGRLPLQAVMAPAIGLAEQGVPVDRELADSLTAALPLLAVDPTSRALFLRPVGQGGRPSKGLAASPGAITGANTEAMGTVARSPQAAPGSIAASQHPKGWAPQSAGGARSTAQQAPAATPSAPGAASPALRALHPGEILRQPLLASTLRRVARDGEAGFYRGPVADALVRLMRQRGGLIRQADLSAYRAELVRPIAGRFRGHVVLSMPPPGGGLTLLQLLGLIEPFDLQTSGAGSAATLHRLTEAMNLAYRDRNTWLGDPASMASPPPDLLAPAYLDQLRRSIDPARHRPAASLSVPPPPRRESVNTTHFSVADSSGGLAALTTTLNFAYGNGVSVPGAGFLLNNEMDDFTAAPGQPNGFGLLQGEANAIIPGRRPLSSMAPTLVFRPDHTPWLATGSPGGSRIITTVAQVLLQRMLWGANLATAVAAPRMHSQLWPDRLALEEGFSPDTRALLGRLGHSLQNAPAMGAANSVEVLAPRGSGSLGVADPRRGRTLAVGE